MYDVERAQNVNLLVSIFVMDVIGLRPPNICVSEGLNYLGENKNMSLSLRAFALQNVVGRGLQVDVNITAGMTL